MKAEHDFYSTYNRYRDIEHGDTIKIEHGVRYKDEGHKQLVPFISLSGERLDELREASTAKEDVLFDAVWQAVTAWEKQAANTMLIDKAKDYLSIRAVEHTSNRWVTDEHKYTEISNMVYKLWFRPSVRTRYDKQADSQIPYSWDLEWSLYSRGVPKYDNDTRWGIGRKIAGQEKRFDSEEKMQKYMNGRFAVYADLFTQISPPIPPEYKKDFCRNGLLMPGYTVQGEESIIAPAAQPALDAGTDYSKFIRKAADKDTRADSAKARVGAAR